MISLERRIELLAGLGHYMLSEDPQWKDAQERALHANSWFTSEHIEIAIRNIATQFLQPEALKAWVAAYPRPASSRIVGMVMAGNIPLVGFHDFLCGFICGHQLRIKPSSKDQVLLSHLIEQLKSREPALEQEIQIADMLRGCDAYIATGSNNTARYFEQYFARFPHLIRRNRTSVAVLDGTETRDELLALGQDVFSYFGLGCRNVTQLCLPEGYDFEPLSDALSVYEDIMLHHKYKNNYDYHLAIYLLNQVSYRTNGSVLMVENELPFSAVSVLHYRYYTDQQALLAELRQSPDIQAIVGRGGLPFGSAQTPSLTDYADGVDTMAFLSGL